MKAEESIEQFRKKHKIGYVWYGDEWAIKFAEAFAKQKRAEGYEAGYVDGKYMAYKKASRK